MAATTTIASGDISFTSAASPRPKRPGTRGRAPNDTLRDRHAGPRLAVWSLKSTGYSGKATRYKDFSRWKPYAAMVKKR
jgi:hypothetical protein